jgi:outer membrane lipoprotein SlyB
VAVAEPPKPAKPKPSHTRGVVTSIEKITQKGEGTGIGAVAGGLVGAVVGYQFGRGTGKALATGGAAAGGALAGHEIEKQARKTVSYAVHVRMQDGSRRTVSFDSEPSFRVGDKVKIVSGDLVPVN